MEGRTKGTRYILLALLGQNRGKGESSIFQRQTAKEDWVGSLSGQNPGLRKAVGKKKCRARGKECHTNTASCKEELDPTVLPAIVTCLCGRRSAVRGRGQASSPGLPPAPLHTAGYC